MTMQDFAFPTVQADFGQVEIQIPRDRLSEFEPILVKKGQRRLAGLDEKVIALYARGLSTRDIQEHLAQSRNFTFVLSPVQIK